MNLQRFKITDKNIFFVRKIKRERERVRERESVSEREKQSNKRIKPRKWIDRQIDR